MAGLPIKFKLKYPIKWGEDSGKIITELNVNRRLKMGDFRDAAQSKLTELETAINLTAKLTGETESLIYEMDPLDFEELTKVLEPFFPKSRPTGPLG